MKDRIENLKRELREFLALSKTITQGRWIVTHNDVISDFIGNAFICNSDRRIDGVFIARSHNISPALAECLLVVVKALEFQATCDSFCAQDDSKDLLQQILTLWEASK